MKYIKDQASGNQGPAEAIARDAVACIIYRVHWCLAVGIVALFFVGPGNALVLVPPLKSLGKWIISGIPAYWQETVTQLYDDIETVLPAPMSYFAALLLVLCSRVLFERLLLGVYPKFLREGSVP